MKFKLSAIGLLALAVLTCRDQTMGFPRSPAEAPGENLGEISSYWLAPYVSTTFKKIDGHTNCTVIWFSKKGGVRQRIASDSEIASTMEPGPMVQTREKGRRVTYGVNELWRCVLPNPGFRHELDAGPQRASIDSHTLIEPFNPEKGKISVDIYVHGVLTNTLGPFTQYGTRGVQMNDDGSMAMLIWKDATKTTPQIVCADSDGNIQFRVDCEDFNMEPIPAPHGMGALLNETCYTSKGKGHTIKGGAASAWVPGSLKSLSTSSVEDYNGSYQLIDWDLGKTLWKFSLPRGGIVLATTITPKFVIFAVAEWYKEGGIRGFQMGVADGRPEIIRAFYAVRTDDGRLISRWQPDGPRRYSGWDNERLMRVGKKTYFVTADQFTALSEDDILSGKKGWEAASE